MSLCRLFDRHLHINQRNITTALTQCGSNSIHCNLIYNSNSTNNHNNLYYTQYRTIVQQTLLRRQKPGHNPLRIRGRGPPPLKPTTHRSPIVKQLIAQQQYNQYIAQYGNQKPILDNVVPLKTNCNIDVRSLSTTNVVDTIQLNNNIFTTVLRGDIIQRVVEWQRAKARAGLANTKSRADVSGTGRKPHPQKGTGRARQGTRRAPHHYKGGVAHGPHNRSFEFKLNKKVRRLGMRTILADKYNTNTLFIVDNIDIESHKTNELIKLLQSHNWFNQRILLCYSKNEQTNNNLFLAGRNLQNRLDFIEQVGLNVLSILRHDILVITRTALNELENRLDEQFRQPTYERQAIDNSRYHQSLWDKLKQKDNNSDDNKQSIQANA